MFRKKKIPNREFIPAKQEIRETSRFTFKELLGGNVFSREVVTRQIPFILYVTAALMLYIFNQYRGENVMRRIVSLEKIIREMRSESVSTAFDLQELSKQSEVIRMVGEQGLPLQEAMTPPYKIVLDE